MPSIPDALGSLDQLQQKNTYTTNLDLWVLASLVIQFGLTFMALTRRRMKHHPLITALTPVFYLYAITITSYAMGVVPDDSTQGGRTGDLRVFWAPFLLLHLGGPNSMTVLSVSDNELWLRYATHLTTLSYTFGRVFFNNYFLRNELWVATLLVFLAGAIKYIERLCCLFGARMTKFRGSTFPRPSPGVNYARIMLAYSSLRRSNIPAEFRVTTATTAAAPPPPEDGPVLNQLQITQKAVRLFRALPGLFANMPYRYSKREQTRRLFLNLDADQALAICEAELQLAYDVFFTKFLLLRNSAIWAISLNLFVFALQLLSLVLWIRVDKSQFKHGSIQVTNALVYGTIGLDVISLHTLLTSDWVVARVDAGCRVGAFLLKFIFFLDPRRSLPYTKRSEMISQLNLFTPERGFKIPPFFSQLPSTHEVRLPDELPKFLFHELQSRSNFAQQPDDVAEICKSRGMWALNLLSDKYGGNGIDLARAFGPWISGVDYEESLVLWHVATTLCCQRSSRDDHVLSKIMSNYMFALLICHTKLLPPSAKFLGAIIFRDTKAEAKRHLVRIPPPRTYSDDDWLRLACESIMKVNTDLIPPEEVLGKDSRSVLFEASVLAKKLQSLDEMGINKWEVMNKVWAEMLFYAAAQCQSSAYVEKLVQGTELLTTVWLLMAHLGLGKHFRHNKAKETRAHLLVTKLT